jgi:hypothetical protein
LTQVTIVPTFTVVLVGKAIPTILILTVVPLPPPPPPPLFTTVGVVLFDLLQELLLISKMHKIEKVVRIRDEKYLNFIFMFFKI